MSLLTVDFVQKLTGDADRWFGPLDATCDHWELNTNERTLFAMAQWAHESTGFKRLRENMHYSAAGLRRMWPNRFSVADAADMEYDEVRIAERAYGGRYGNGPEGSGDGFKFRGGGITQLTFHDNYADAGEAVGLDLVRAPALLEEPRYAATVAGYYWFTRGCNELADALDFEAITKAISGATDSNAQRLAWLDRINEMVTA